MEGCFHSHIPSPAPVTPGKSNDAYHVLSSATPLRVVDFQSCEPLPDHPRGRGPVSIDDTPGTAPVATVPILVSNSARGGRNTDQQPDPDTPLATPRSERSVASGSRGGGSGGARGKAFVTQT